MGFNQCKVVKDICYYTKDLDNNNVQFTVNQCQTRIFFAGNEYCDNCPSGQAIKVEDDYLVCGDLVDCTNEHDFTCLNQDNTTFSEYTYNNKSDEFSECVYWKINEDTTENKKQDCLTQKTCMKECKVECPTLEKDGVSIPSFRDGLNCRPIKNI